MSYVKRMIKSKRGLSMMILVLSTLVIGLSYGTFIITTDKYKTSELLIGELNYGIKIEEDEPKISNINANNVTIPKNSKSYYDITITSVNKIESNYTLAYNKEENVIVEYTDKTPWSTEGYIKGYDEKTYSKTIRVVIENKTNEEKEITFKVFGGYSYNSIASIEITNGYYSITGPYKETLSITGEKLIDQIEKDTKCNEERCLYGGGSINNYVQYPEDKDKSKNLWRIIGSYTIDNTKVSKLISLNNSTSSKTNITNTLTSFYNTLNNKDSIIYKTNKFNCNSNICEETEYQNIGLITTSEYEEVGGINSYLKPESSYFAINNGNINNITESGIEEVNDSTTSVVRPSIYIKNEVKVNGSGTKEDPYIIKEESDINLISYTYKGSATTMSYEDLVKTKYVQSITCKNGSQVKWNEEEKSAKFTNIKSPDYCTIDFGDEPLYTPIGKTLYSVLTGGKMYPTINTRGSGSFDSAFGLGEIRRILLENNKDK